MHLRWNELAPLPAPPNCRFELLDSGSSESDLSYRYWPEWNARVPGCDAEIGDVFVGTGRRQQDREYGVELVQMSGSGYWLPATTLRGKPLLKELPVAQQVSSPEIDHSSMTASELKQLDRQSSPQTAFRLSAMAQNVCTGTEGVLTIQVQQAVQLPSTIQKSDEVCVVLTMGSQYQETAPRRMDPSGAISWKELFFFAVEDYTNITLDVVLLVHEQNDSHLGQLSIPIVDIVVQGGELEKRWYLADGGELYMSCMWKGH